MMKSRILTGCAALLAAGTTPALAGDDVAAQLKYEEALINYGGRDAEDSEPTDTALKLVDEAIGLADDAEILYDAKVLKAKVLYWQGGHVSDKDAKLDKYWSGYTVALEAVNKMKELKQDWYSDAYYFAGINLGRWGKTKGAVNAYGKRCELLDYMKVAMTKSTRAGVPGKTMEGWGPSRVLGKLHYELEISVLPHGTLQCDNYPDEKVGYASTARVYLDDAVKYSENPGSYPEEEGTLDDEIRKQAAYKVLLNRAYRDETWSHKKAWDDEATWKTKKAEAKADLEEVVKVDAYEYNEERIPETLDDVKEAQEILDKWE